MSTKFRPYNESDGEKMIFNSVNVLLIPMTAPDGLPYTLVREFNRETDKFDKVVSERTIRKLNKYGPQKGKPYSRFDLHENVEDDEYKPSKSQYLLLLFL